MEIDPTAIRLSPKKRLRTIEEVTERVEKAAFLKIRGKTDFEIVRELGYRNVQDLTKDISVYREMREAENKDDLRIIECDKLDLLTSVLMDRALGEGDITAIKTIADLIKLKSNILGLFRAEERAPTSIQNTQENLMITINRVDTTPENEKQRREKDEEEIIDADYTELL